MKATNTDILVIGGGVIGNSIAYHLASRDARYLSLIDHTIANSPAASWASAGGVRRQGRHPAEAKLAIDAIQRWKTLELELEADLHYRRGGNLLLAESDIEANQLSKFVDKQHEMGFTDVQFVDRHEALSLVPELNHELRLEVTVPMMDRQTLVLTTRRLC